MEHLGHTPNATELQALMALMDKDRNGQVTWNEFIRTMSDWLGVL